MNETAGAFEVLRKLLNFLARRTRFKRVTFAFGGQC
ncbi:ABC-type xylose transport system permease subunit [Bradyrhizobium sp. AZCC 1588]